MNIVIEETRRKVVEGSMVHYPITRVTIAGETGELKALVQLREPGKADTLCRQLLAYIRMNSLDGATPPCFTVEEGEGGLVLKDDIQAALEALVTLKLLNQQTVNEAIAGSPELKRGLENSAALCQEARAITEAVERAATLFSPETAERFKNRLVNSISALEPAAPVAVVVGPRARSSS